MDKKLNILIISSMSPYHSAHLGGDIIDALTQNGHHVDFLTKYKVENSNYNILSLYNRNTSWKQYWMHNVKSLFPFFGKMVSLFVGSDKDYNETPFIVHYNEEKPPVDSQLVINKISKKYDLIITSFWQGMLTARSIYDIYSAIKCPIFIFPVDMFPFTGGCYYFGKCTNFLHSCGNCPGMHSNNLHDQSNHNYLYKREIYKAINCLFFVNSWTYDNLIQHSIVPKEKMIKGVLTINENRFFPKDQLTSRAILKIDKKYEFVMFAGAPDINLPRKGFKYLVESINKFANMLSDEQRGKILLLLAGGDKEKNAIIDAIDGIDTQYIGFVSTEQLIVAYNVADAFLCPSVDDAGPSMVNQSLMCGTPVIAFNSGTAIDVVSTNITGYNAKYKNTDDFSIGMYTIYSMTDDDRKIMRKNCRRISLDKSSLKVLAANIEKCYNSICENTSSIKLY